ncbi:MAG: hypothetical protein HQ446_06230 [Polaromonas sp.]|nr:hypothetical protein [Polaromonas sp.]
MKQDFSVPNLVVTSGKVFIASRMIGTEQNVMSHMALGTGTTAAVVANKSLQTEVFRNLFSAFSSSSAVITYTANFIAGQATGAMTEAGVFSASTGGTMLCRTVFPVVNKGADDAMSITWTVTIQ